MFNILPFGRRNKRTRQQLSLEELLIKSTTSSTGPTSAQRVFGIYELLESILLCLPPLDVIRSRSINRRWNDIVNSSVPLRRHCFLTPSSPDPASPDPLFMTVRLPWSPERSVFLNGPMIPFAPLRRKYFESGMMSQETLVQYRLLIFDAVAKIRVHSEHRRLVREDVNRLLHGSSSWAFGDGFMVERIHPLLIGLLHSYEFETSWTGYGTHVVVPITDITVLGIQELVYKLARIATYHEEGRWHTHMAGNQPITRFSISMRPRYACNDDEIVSPFWNIMTVSNIHGVTVKQVLSMLVELCREAVHSPDPLWGKNGRGTGGMAWYLNCKVERVKALLWMKSRIDEAVEEPSYRRCRNVWR